ncbi:hypothetical protein C8R30_101161 [Nitrosomonas nitrosa]|uniref:hypothetical protein n=1 Tax=Nitrosomonas nitrosa TaxID=52442 RepID=UPI000D2FBB90|nr:hypothetical protein [Nitrosomonas nitrosa]PTR04964.1 hypothetical protein C8R30_101161 [Nitrosomonas nitrosa]
MKLSEKIKVISACPPAALTSTAGDGKYISLRNVEKVSVVLNIKNGSTVTAGNVALYQSSNVLAAGEKVLPFTSYYKNEDVANTEVLVSATASDNHFLTNTTNTQLLQYVIEVPLFNLDHENGYDCIRVDVASMANAVGDAFYLVETKQAPADVTLTED